MSDESCGCIKCFDKRAKGRPQIILIESLTQPGLSWRYACEICGNKRCPHHSDHTLACTNSNEPGQPGSLL